MDEADDRADEIKEEVGMADNTKDYQTNAAKVLSQYVREDGSIREDTKSKLEYIANHGESPEAREIANKALNGERYNDRSDWDDDYLDYRERFNLPDDE